MRKLVTISVIDLFSKITVVITRSVSKTPNDSQELAALVDRRSDQPDIIFTSLLP